MWAKTIWFKIRGAWCKGGRQPKRVPWDWPAPGHTLVGLLDSQTLAEPKAEFSDSDWASSVEDRHSTTGYCFSLNKVQTFPGNLKQPTVAPSTCEAEYIGLPNTTQESMYPTQLLNGIKDCIHAPRFMETIRELLHWGRTQRTDRCKHIDVKYHFIREALSLG